MTLAVKDEWRDALLKAAEYCVSSADSATRGPDMWPDRAEALLARVKAGGDLELNPAPMQRSEQLGDKLHVDPAYRDDRTMLRNEAAFLLTDLATSVKLESVDDRPDPEALALLIATAQIIGALDELDAMGVA